MLRGIRKNAYDLSPTCINLRAKTQIGARKKKSLNLEKKKDSGIRGKDRTRKFVVVTGRRTESMGRKERSLRGKCKGGKPLNYNGAMRRRRVGTMKDGWITHGKWGKERVAEPSLLVEDTKGKNGDDLERRGCRSKRCLSIKQEQRNTTT